MASTNGSEAVDPGAGVARQRAAGVQRATGGAAGAATSSDPAVLAQEIERTREDLAETLDLIAEKVSPKRVADRTKKRVAAAADVAKERIVEQAGAAKDRLVEQAGAAKVAAAEARGKVVEQAGAAREKVAPTSAVVAGSVQLEPTSSPAYARPTDSAGLPPVSGVPVPHLDLSTAPVASSTPPPARHASPASGGAAELKKEYLAGGALGALVLLLLRRRRTKRRRATAAVVVRGRGRR